VILGPTAAGKSWISIEIAVAFRGEVVNADAYQIYRGMDVGTGKVLEENRKGIPHHLIDIRRPNEYFSAGQFRELAGRAIEEIRARGNLPIVVGGTGLYIRSLLRGLFAGPSRSEAIRQRLERIERGKGIEFLYRLLLRNDPVYAGRIASADRQRVKRALEVYFQSGRPMSEYITQHGLRDEAYRPIKIGLKATREDLNRRIERRVHAMFESGFVEEVRSLLEMGYSPEGNAFKGIGYRWVVGLLRGELPRQKAIEMTCRDTRKYAKRQMTWFSKEDGVAWFDAGDPEERLKKSVFETVARQLGSGGSRRDSRPDGTGMGEQRESSAGMGGTHRTNKSVNK
jgi:tRNA dimethylallyltransferase